MKLIKQKFYLIIFFCCLLFSISLYQSSLGYYFFQDDFFEIGSARASNFWEYLGFFTFRPDIIDWRPVSQLNYFFFLKKLFGLNPTEFRAVSYILYLVTAFLIAKTIGKITKDQNIGLLSASFWLISSVHFMNLTWISASYNIVGTFFFMLTSFLFVKYLQSQNKVYYLLSFVTFFLSLGSFEFTVTWPILFIFYIALIVKYSTSKVLNVFSPYLIISSAYLIARLLFMRVPKIPEYTLALNLESIKALFWYLLWTFNIPEEFKKQVVNNLIILNSQFFKEFYSFILKTIFGFVLFLIVSLIFPLLLTMKRKIYLDLELITFLIFWFLITISPVLIIPNHTFIMYLSLSSIGLYSLVAYLLLLQKNKLLVLTALITWFLLSSTTLSFYKHNYWMIGDQRLAYKFKADLEAQFPYLPPNSVVLYPLDDIHVMDHRQMQALQGNDAIRTIYNDQTLSIFYNKEMLVKNLDIIKNRPIYIYVR